MTVKIEPSLDGATIITQPMVRNFSTGGGHGPGDTMIEGEPASSPRSGRDFRRSISTIIGKPQAPLREVVEPRYRGTAEFATRVRLPGMLHAKFVRSPYPRAAIRRLDTTAAEKMPGVHHILTYRNAPKTVPLQVELVLQGEIVAIVAAETENQAEDAAEAIAVDYLDLPSVPTSPSPNPARAGSARRQGQPAADSGEQPQSSPGRQRPAGITATSRRALPNPTACASTPIISAAAASCRCSLSAGSASWEGDKLTFWGHGQDIYPSRDALAGWLGIDKQQGSLHQQVERRHVRRLRRALDAVLGTCGAYRQGDRAARQGVLTKAEELYHISHKPETVSKFKVGLTKDGRIHALRYELHMIAGLMDVPPAHVINEVSKNQLELYTARMPHWEQVSYAYKSNTPMIGCNRSCTQQEVKWAFENLADELAEAAEPRPGRVPAAQRRAARRQARSGDRLARGDEEAGARERRTDL